MPVGKYVIGTGYYRESERSEQFLVDTWHPNTVKYANPEYTVIVTSATPVPRNWLYAWPRVKTIDLPVNPQCGRRLKKDVAFSGWALGFIHGAIYAYSCGCDYIYKEQDCLAFGPWVEHLYEQADRQNVGMLCGELYEFPTPGYLEQCLVFLRYDYIMPFLSGLLSNTTGESKQKPEQKFSTVMNSDRHSGMCGFFTMGFGGNRPYDAEDKIFYIQKPRWDYKKKKIIKMPIGCLVPDEELADLKKRGLL